MDDTPRSEHLWGRGETIFEISPFVSLGKYTGSELLRDCCRHSIVFRDGGAEEDIAIFSAGFGECSKCMLAS